ncbi:MULTISPECIES: purine-cytosine permease family protein [Amycolatopsis]|uniref:Cytosine permease n=1 Tax=Amycolatopsis thermalba TaxID=944492 RepID=A0ABY4P0Q8_9PSEU|nr:MULTISPECIES: cytosine permease [Amycolatopsis]OXM64654.1 cytosine permease [Amycolatopsis sp. KNN50.9b]UQS25945.1 cytosine permease [Amycolatopsis thermalba]
MAPNETLQVEKHSIDFVPHSERYGKARGLFPIWFTVNANMLTIATGAVAVALGLPLAWAIVAAVAGHGIGAVFMAAHSAQGPVLGIPQMIQSRAQFGYRGAVLPLVLVVLMYLGYIASGAVLAGNALAELLGWDVDVSIVLTTVAATVIAIFGYRLMQVWVNAVSWVTAIAFAVLTIGFFFRNDVGGAFATGEFSWGVFLLAVTLSATWQLTYAPYVADYSRYLPARTSAKATFWWTYAGSVVSSVWMFVFGALLAAAAPEAFGGGSVRFVAEQAGFAPWLFLAIMVLSSLPILAVDLYGAFMSLVTITGALRHARTISKRGRVLTVSLLSATGVLIAILGRGDFLDNLENFIVLLAVVLVPWTSINLVDFYFVRKERYDVADIFNPAGRYQGTDWRAITAYAVGVAVEVPFMSTALYTGPLVEVLGGADISWLVGLVVSAVAFYVLMKRYPVRRGYAPVPEGPELSQARAGAPSPGVPS